MSRMIRPVRDTYREQSSEVQAEEEVNALDKAGKSNGERGAVGTLVSDSGLWSLQKGEKITSGEPPRWRNRLALGLWQTWLWWRVVVRIEDVNEVE